LLRLFIDLEVQRSVYVLLRQRVVVWDGMVVLAEAKQSGSGKRKVLIAVSR
jgi:hypothetical protein